MKDEKIEFADWLVNNMVASMIYEVSKQLGIAVSINDSKNREKLSKHKQDQLLDLEHHLYSALRSLQEYFMLRDEEAKDE